MPYESSYRQNRYTAPNTFKVQHSDEHQELFPEPSQLHTLAGAAARLEPKAMAACQPALDTTWPIYPFILQKARSVAWAAGTFLSLIYLAGVWISPPPW
eukprot:1157346-Pelagomonas_calceolata.AAC.9